LSIRAYQQMVAWLAREHIREVKLYPFLSMVDRRKRQHRELPESLARDIRTLLPVSIPYLSSIEAMGQHRAPLCAYAPKDPGAQAFERLWLEVSSRLASV
ncbi:MAG: ParA family protein, partial [Thioalkalivibrio sp.]